MLRCDFAMMSVTVYQCLFMSVTSLGNSGLSEPFSHGTGTLRCLQKEMATYRYRPNVFMRRDPDDVPCCRILSSDKAEWRLILATPQMKMLLWFMTRIREEEDGRTDSQTVGQSYQPSVYCIAFGFKC